MKKSILEGPERWYCYDFYLSESRKILCPPAYYAVSQCVSAEKSRMAYFASPANNYHHRMTPCVWVRVHAQNIVLYTSLAISGIVSPCPTLKPARIQHRVQVALTLGLKLSYISLKGTSEQKGT